MALLHVSLLAPVPRQHLESGLATQKAEGKVAYGSDDESALSKLQSLLHGGHADVFICATPCDAADPKATWKATFLGYMPGVGAVKHHPAGAKYRPKSTEQEEAKFYWEVTDLAPLPEAQWISITDFLSYRTDKPYQPFTPRRPLLVRLPS